jgi:hypothetical protein
MSDDVEREITEGAYGRRTFLRRLAIGSAFAVPVVSSFSMAGIQAVTAHANPINEYPINNCNQFAIQTNQTLMVSNQGFGGPGEEFGNVPICNPNQGQEGFLGFLEDIFSVGTRRP